MPALKGRDVDDLKGRQHLYNGFGDTFTKGMEMVLTPMLMGGIGYLLDRVIGMVPVLTIVFLILGIVGVGVKEYYTYEAAIAVQEEGKPWVKNGRKPDGAGS